MTTARYWVIEWMLAHGCSGRRFAQMTADNSILTIAQITDTMTGAIGGQAEMSDDPYDYTSPLMKTVPAKGRRGAPDDTVTIPRPQYEALMAAVKALPGAERIIGDMKGSDVWREYDAVCNALHALRAAGIETGKGK